MLVDTVLNSNVFATRMLGAAKRWNQKRVKFPVKTSKNTTGGSFDGFDLLSTTASDTRQNMQYDPKFYHIDVAVPLTELAINATPDEVIDLAAIELESSAQDMADDIGTIFYGDGTGNGSKDFNGLGNLVDDGTTAATIGGLTRATFTPSLDGTVTASGGTLTLALMRTLQSNITSGAQKPTIGVTTETVWDLYAQLLNPQERIAKDVPMMRGGVEGGTGFTGLNFRGFPVVADEKCTSGVLFFLNENFIDWKALSMPKTMPVNFKSQDIKGNDYSSVKGLGFSWSDWIMPANQAALVGHIYLGGNLVTNNPKRHGKLTGITGV